MSGTEDAKLLAEVISARNTEYEVDDLTDKILKMSEGMEDAFGGIQDILKPFMLPEMSLVLRRSEAA